MQVNSTRKFFTNLMENGMNENYYKYYSFFIDGVVNIIDYFNPDLTVVYKMEECLKAASFLEEQTYYYYRELYKIGHALKSYSFFDDFCIFYISKFQ